MATAGARPQVRTRGPDAPSGARSRAPAARVRTWRQWLLPPALRGPSRRAAYRRAQVRRLLAAVGAAAAVGIVVSAYLPAEEDAGVDVVVAARALPVGHVVAEDDLQTVRWPADRRPEAALALPGSAVGRRLASPVTAGEAITTARLVGTGLVAGAPPGTVVVRVPLADPSAAVLAGAGSRVDLVSTTTGESLASSATVLAADTGADQAAAATPGLLGGSASAPGGTGLLVAVPPSAVAGLARALGDGASSGVFVVALAGSQ